MLGFWKRRKIVFPEIEGVLREEPRPRFADAHEQELLRTGRAFKALIADADWKIGPTAQYDWPDHVGLTLLFDANGKRHRRTQKLAYYFEQAGNQNHPDHTRWFKTRVKKDEFVTILFSREDSELRGEFRLFGELRPFVNRSFSELLERFRASASPDVALLSPLLDIIKGELPGNRALHKALRSVAGLYTRRGDDDFYIVGDLHHAFRTGKITRDEASEVLATVESTVATATIPVWVAD